MCIAVASVDHLLYAERKLTQWAGGNMLDAQVLDKVDRAKSVLNVADVVFFGGSFIRYGISYRPFFERRIIGYNFAFNGGGPVGAFYALQDLAHVLRTRNDKPVIVLELVDQTLVRTDPDWSGLLHANALLRSRARQLSEFQHLYPNFRIYGQGDRFLSNIMLPSLMYRRYIRELINTRTLQGYFQGPDDLVGFSPLLKDQASTKAKMINRPQISMEQIVPTKLSYIRRFLSLAETLTNQVIVISSPDITRVNDNRDRFDILLEQLKYEFPFIKVLRQPDYNLRYNHFSNDGFYHLNVDGADFFTEKVLAKSGIKEHPDYDSRLNRIQRQIDIRPPLQDDQQIANSGSLSFDADANDILYQSRRIKVQGSGDLVLNVEFSLDEGVVYACIQGFDQEEVTGGLKSEYCGFVDSKKPDYPALARHSAEWPWISVQIRVPKPSRGTIKSISLFQEIPAD